MAVSPHITPGDAEEAVGAPVDVRVVGNLLLEGGRVRLNRERRRRPRRGVPVDLDTQQRL